MLAITNAGKTREWFWKTAGERTWRVEISKGEIPGSKRGMHGYTLTYSNVKGEPLCFQQVGP